MNLSCLRGKYGVNFLRMYRSYRIGTLGAWDWPRVAPGSSATRNHGGRSKGNIHERLRDVVRGANPSFSWEMQGASQAGRGRRRSRGRKRRVVMAADLRRDIRLDGESKWTAIRLWPFGLRDHRLVTRLDWTTSEIDITHTSPS
jgi:hypothetical protein